MTTPTDVQQKVQNWFLAQELPALLRTGAAFAAGHLTSGHLAPVLAHWGITIDPAKFSSSLETWGVGIVAAVLAHYGVAMVGVQADRGPVVTPPAAPPAPPAPPTPAAP